MSSSSAGAFRRNFVKPHGIMRHPLKMFIRMVLLGVSMATVLVGAYWTASQLQTAKVFALEEVAVHGQARAARAELLRYLDAHVGDNVFALNLEILRSNVMRHPWVLDAQVHRVVPNKLEVEISEHVPAGIVALGRLYYVDKSGEPFSRVLVEDAEDFPIITGLDADLFERDRDEWNRLVQLGLAFSDASRRQGLILGAIQVDDALGVIAHLPPSGTTAAFGHDDFEQKIHKLRDVRSLLQQRGQAAEAFYLDNARHPERVVARIAKKEKTPLYIGAR